MDQFVCVYVLQLGIVCNHLLLLAVGVICCLLCVILLPVVVIFMVYDWLW